MELNKQQESKIRVKSGVLKRGIKELKMYEEEVKSGTKKLEEIGSGHERYRQLQQVLEESKTMVLYTNNRLENARDDLEKELESVVDAAKDHPQILEARNLLQSVPAI
mmetsp:Transcript_12515/g.14372  ORF Transcript_12515/g.14372 Transcript_12515/m.14372 type:complete len:108 (+) Transcript_12515:127-450(+)|eukprot:CAMPEP_0184021918 /NCGR_PEP_ID=MMETSP0954-20121128/10236_1 /TAXON_ID=627963 /ORGANISM="Aplanochytrium sp, Strain PBS07" /LENGTH=107 /DNA_ID=CAMNT_0026304073 /DNA_START=87 /DNA_END=410 /DNA_ORIENTATION=+